MDEQATYIVVPVDGKPDYDRYRPGPGATAMIR
jgi:hypothetical protein